MKSDPREKPLMFELRVNRVLVQRSAAPRAWGETMSAAELARQLFAQGWACRAVAMYSKLIKTEPTAENYTMLAELYAQQGLFDDSAAMHVKAIQARL